MKQRQVFINFVVIIMLVLIALGVSLAGLAGLAQAAPVMGIGNDSPEFIAPANVPLRQGVVLTITKSAEPHLATAGSVLTYTISLVNGGDAAASNVIITDTLPSSVTVASADGGLQDGQNVVWNVASIPAGDTITRTLLVTVGDVISGALLNNTVVVTSDEGIGDNDTLNTTVTTSADLVITKEATPAPLFVGDPLTYTLTVTNNGPSTAAGVVVTDTLPLSATFSSASTGCSAASGVVSCSMGNINSEVTKVVTIAAIATNPGVLTNMAVVSSSVTDPDADNNTASAVTTVTPKADLTISKIGSSDPITAGTSLTYTLIITNNGPSPAENVVVTDTLPLSMSIQSVTPATSTQSGQQLGWNLGSLALGATQTITIVAKVGGDVRNSIQNTATVTSTTIDLTPGNNSYTETTTINTQTDLSVIKTDSPDPVQLNNFFGYTVQVTNAGPSDALAVVLTDNLPASVFFVGFLPAPSQGTCSTSTMTCNFGKIVSGGSASVGIFVRADAAGVITNTASVTSSENDPDPTNNTDTENTTVNPANLSVVKTVSPGPIRVGTPFTYTLSVASAPGFYRATGVTLVDNLPPTVTYKSASSTQGSCSGTATVTCTLGIIESGASPIIVTIVVTPTAAGLITNTATITSDVPDPIPANNAASITTTVDPVADLSVAKMDSTDPVTAGTSLTYTLIVTNNGPSPATGVGVTDPLPAGVTFVSASPGCSGSSTVTCSLGGIAGSATKTVSIHVTVNPSTIGVITNTVSVTGSEFDSNTLNNSATITTTVNRKVNLSITKSSSPNLVAAGSSLTYTLTVSNSGPSLATNVVVSDTLPAGVTLALASSGCSNSGNNVTCNLGNIANGGTGVALIRVTVNASTIGLITNTARVTSTETDLNLTDNIVTATTTVTRVTDMAITASDSPDPVTQGNNLAYNLTVTNNGPSNATSVSVTHTLPAGVTFQSVTPGSPTCSHAGGVVSCSLGSMAKGSSSNISVVVKVDPPTVGNISGTASVTVTGSSDPNMSNNSAVATTFVNGLQKVYLPFIIKPPPTELSVFNDKTGGNVTFTVIGTGVSCTVPNNSTLFCGSFPPGTYNVQVTSACGNATTAKFYDSGPQTTRVFCK
ncbi:MAG: DUF11 domain-containing protein [Anaerolineales bacterium]|nr:DUF11 domain-containing protein [Anaerolineales bacterium]